MTDTPQSGFAWVAVIAICIAALWLLKDSLQSMVMSLMPNKAAPTATETGTTASGAPIVGSDVKYVNPIICAISGKFCDPNSDAPSENTGINSNIVGMFQGVPVIQQDYGYTVTPVGSITTRYCERDPALQMTKVTNILAKMNKGVSPTLDEARWAKQCEPALFGMMGSDLKSAVESSVGVV